jgi:hypothetical protein
MVLRNSLFVLLTAAGLFVAARAESHSLNPESVDRHAEITLTPSRMAVIYEIIFGIAPTERFASVLDSNRDNQISDEERNVFVKKVSDKYAPNQIVQIGGAVLPLQFVKGDTYRTIGHNGINVLKVDLGYVSDLPAEIPRETTLTFQYKDANLEKVPGWKQIKFSPMDGVRFSGHIPYQDFGKFDYNIINTKGFIPATDSIQLEIWLPASNSAPNSARDSGVVMPERSEVDFVSQTLGLDLLYQVWMVLAGIGALIAFGYFGLRWMQRRNSQ